MGDGEARLFLLPLWEKVAARSAVGCGVLQLDATSQLNWALRHNTSVSLRWNTPHPSRRCAPIHLPPQGGKEEAQAFPISTPAANTSAPPSTTWKAARRNGVCM
ncbi:hypothetical protein MesoLj113a_08350 [Mesorhizobium sp. 113-1-2]|nr:hypothetical protein MesoLj113a_08350 [Mesorhizobium sp. 113-1-2]